tara:strand:- start:235 stop:687 length:453 start_codon:yes stop_codon:yes gene_type:complete
MPEPVDTVLYEKVKKNVYKDIPKHSAYRSGILVQKYKKAFFDKYGNKSPYIGERTKDKGIGRWFREKWVNQRGEIGYKNKNDIYRPSVRITKDTPLVHGEISKKEIQRARKEKYRTGRVMVFKGTKKKIGKKSSKSKKNRRNTRKHVKKQ